MSPTAIQIFALIAWSACVLGVLIYVLVRIFKNPFQYPYFVQEFDVSGKRNVKIENYIDNYLCTLHAWEELRRHEKSICNWKSQCEARIQSSKLKKHRAKQYQSVLDDENAYCFTTIRMQTRYRQVNYVKHPYTVSVIDSECSVSWDWLNKRYNRLREIGFEATLEEYECKNQRKLLTKKLRKQIMERDNYTCQTCGKYMPDEVGLQIDHIIPVSKGGKTVASNLRVLCNKCNGSKGAKLQPDI